MCMTCYKTLKQVMHALKRSFAGPINYSKEIFYNGNASIGHWS